MIITYYICGHVVGAGIIGKPFVCTASELRDEEAKVSRISDGNVTVYVLTTVDVEQEITND